VTHIGVLLQNIFLVRRYTGGGPNRPRFDTPARARVLGFQPNEIVDGSAIRQGDRRVILLAEDLMREQFPLPLQINDQIVLRGKELAIVAMDDSTRRVGDDLIAYELHVRG
jgi:hypothetical protein